MIIDRVCKFLNMLITISYRIRNKNRNFTIISQNCAAGIIYKKLRLRFDSPTINLFIEDENFVKLVENLEYYLACKPEPITDEYVDPHDNSIRYPVFKIDDIVICCLHYRNCDEAIKMWERRKQRVNFDNIFVIGNSWNLHQNMEYINRICNCKYPSVVLSFGIQGNDRCINFSGNEYFLDKRGVLKPDIFQLKKHSIKSRFEKNFDFVAFLNKKGKYDN